MALRHDEQERLFVEREARELVVGGIGRDHGGVDLALDQHRQQAVGQVLDDLDRRLRQVADRRGSA